ncbi:NUMOD3 domain-containing DNA-binding protein [Methanobrevibacter sp.]
MSIGVYCYKDSLNDDSIVYIGKDSNIHKNERFKAHMRPSTYDAQPFNRALQNNPDRYKYEVLKSWDDDEFSDDLASALEIIYIRRYNPKFNFTVGGEGLKGYVPSDETCRKISKSLKGKTHSMKTRKKMSQSHTNKYPTIHKSGFNQDGKQIYVLRNNGKIIKYSIYLDKLKKLLNLLIKEEN